MMSIFPCWFQAASGPIQRFLFHCHSARWQSGPCYGRDRKMSAWICLNYSSLSWQCSPTQRSRWNSSCPSDSIYSPNLDCAVESRACMIRQAYHWSSIRLLLPYHSTQSIILASSLDPCRPSLLLPSGNYFLSCLLELPRIFRHLNWYPHFV